MDRVHIYQKATNPILEGWFPFKTLVNVNIKNSSTFKGGKVELTIDTC